MGRARVGGRRIEEARITMRAPLYLDADYRNAVDMAELRFKLMSSDFAKFEDLVRKGMNFGIPKQSIDTKIGLMNQNFFSEELFTAMMCGGESYKSTPVAWAWDKLVESRIVFRAFSDTPNFSVSHVIDTPVLFERVASQTLKNLFFGPSYLASAYSNALVAIDVCKDGRDFRGSGFLVQTSIDSPVWLVTCKHNVDPNDGILLSKISNKNQTIGNYSDFAISEQYDLAISRVEANRSQIYFRLFSGFEIFDPVFTLGFPNVPCAETELIGHRGELNGVANLYLQKHEALIISNYMTPGSSGCPVLRSDGLCIGMTIKWLEGEWEGESARFSAALPASEIGAQIDALAKRNSIR